MTKKDYELIASTLRAQEYIAGLTYETLVKNLATALADTNPRFDRARFLTACGVN